MKSLTCPLCGKNAQDKYRPFCSSRCANLDLGNWLNEDYRVSVIEDDDLDDIGDVSFGKLLHSLLETFTKEGIGLVF